MIMRFDDLSSPASERSAPATDAPGPDDGLRYIVVEGVIGAGKTTLARLLAEHLSAQLVLEEFEENPFLDRFYADPVRWAFQTQLTFLASRFRQQKGLFERDLFHDAVVSDYAFDKDRIFAHLNLTGDELQLYETLYTLMAPVTPRPDLVVYLQSSTDRLMENIRKRDRSYERSMDRDYIDRLNEAYHYYFRRYTKSPLLVVDATEIDFVGNLDDRRELLERITRRPSDGTRHRSAPSRRSL